MYLYRGKDILCNSVDFIFFMWNKNKRLSSRKINEVLFSSNQVVSRCVRLNISVRFIFPYNFSLLLYSEFVHCLFLHYIHDLYMKRNYVIRNRKCNFAQVKKIVFFNLNSCVFSIKTTKYFAITKKQVFGCMSYTRWYSSWYINSIPMHTYPFNEEWFLFLIF